MRLNNIKMVKPELSDLVEQYLIGLATQGKMNSQITDDQLKQILLSTQQPKHDFKINRI
jgi:programmed cell death protein 5